MFAMNSSYAESVVGAAAAGLLGTALAGAGGFGAVAGLGFEGGGLFCVLRNAAGIIAVTSEERAT